MLRTRFTEMASCPVPTQQAGMGGVSQPRLAAAVSQAGGLSTAAARQAGVVDPCTLAQPKRCSGRPTTSLAHGSVARNWWFWLVD